jgi:uncharacterized protein YjiS (DUF1127 family)
MTHTVANFGHARLKTSTSTLRLLSMVANTYRQRRALARLDDIALLDLGISRKEADAEVKRPIWDVPSYWRC